MAEFFLERESLKRARYENTSSQLDVDPSTAPVDNGTGFCINKNFVELWSKSPQMKEVLEILAMSPSLHGEGTIASQNRIESTHVRSNAAKKVRDRYFTLAEVCVRDLLPCTYLSATAMDVEDENQGGITAMRSYNTTGNDPKSVQLIDPSNDMLVRCIAAIIEAEIRGSDMNVPKMSDQRDSATITPGAESQGGLNECTFDVESEVSKDFRCNIQKPELMQQDMSTRTYCCTSIGCPESCTTVQSVTLSP